MICLQRRINMESYSLFTTTNVEMKQNRAKSCSFFLEKKNVIKLRHSKGSYKFFDEMLCEYYQHIIIPWSILPHIQIKKQKTLKSHYWSATLRQMGLRESVKAWIFFFFFSTFMELDFWGTAWEVLIWFSNVQTETDRKRKGKKRKKLLKAKQKENRKSTNMNEWMNSSVLILIPKKTKKIGPILGESRSREDRL